MQPAAPLIFISYSHADQEWKDRILIHLRVLQKAGQVSAWDIEQSHSGQEWPPAMRQALASCRVALLLVSADFLASPFIESEDASMLQRRTQAGEALLVPVILRDCLWQEIPWLAKFQAWPGNGKPLSRMPPSEAEASLVALVRRIQALLSEPPPAPAGRADAEQKPAGQAPGQDLQFSESMQTLLKQAGELAERSGRGAITPSCLLFALAKTPGGEESTAQFFRNVLETTGNYSEALERFLKEAPAATSKAIHDGGPVIGKIRDDALKVLIHAETFSARTAGAPSAGRPAIHLRHVFAALVSFPDPRNPIARSRLEAMGFALAALRRDFHEYVAGHGYFGEDAEAWNSILLVDSQPNPDGSFVTGPPGYTSEYCGVGGREALADHLRVDAAARRLAELIALRETKLPLAVGLFGDWGSGKSHFMSLMDQHIQEFARQGRAGAPASPWHGEIVPVYFNAWHYIDANLWASLVTGIFNGLFAHLQKKPQQSELETLREQLKAAGGAAARAEDEAAHAAQAARQAEEAFRQARQDSLGASRALEALLLGELRSLLPQINTEEGWRRVADWLGLKEEDRATLSTLKEKREEMAALSGRARALWRRMAAREGLPGRLAWLAGTLLAVPCAFWLAESLTPGAGAWLERAGAWMQPSATALATAAAGWMKWYRPAARELERQLAELESLQQQAEEAQKARSETPEVKAAAAKVERAKAAEVGAQADLAAARALERQLALALDEAQPEKRLARFIEGRATSADYRGQLGLVSLVRKDFEELSDIFADAGALAKKLRQLQQDEGLDGQAKAAKIKELSRSVDRIVLFIDDLDRCQPERVVDVLQAVHLLLAFPLFAVVVGVDQRCLRQSLRMQFQGLLTPGQDADPAAPEGTGLASGERPATPLDYLEKIFHIPFHLPPMEQDGFGNLIEKLTEPPPAPVPEANVGAGGGEGESGKTQEAGGGQEASAGTDPPKTGGQAGTQTAGLDAGEAEAQTPPESRPPQTMGSVPLHRWERDALKDYHALIRTPRGATRLLNTYRLVRAGVPQDEWEVFRGDEKHSGEFRVAMLLLAAAAGHPAVAHEWFKKLRNADVSPPPAAGNGAWAQFMQIYDDTCSAHASPQTLDRWLGRVERFTF